MVLFAVLLGLLAGSVMGTSGQSSADANCGESLQSLINATPAGATLQVPTCTYREQVTISRPITVQGQPRSEIRGSDVWSAWRHDGATWVSEQAVPTLPVQTNHDGRCGEPTNRCVLPEQVFFDGQALARASSEAVPSSGQFALNGARQVVLRDEPNGHTIEVSTRQHWIVTKSDGVTIDGMTMRHAANDAQTGAVSNDGYSDWTLSNSVVSYAHGAVVNMESGTNVRVLHNDISSGGDMGVHGTKVRAGLVQGNHIHGNNTDQFSVVWGAGGLKAAEVNGLVIDDNEADNNAAVGLWCDVGCRDVTFSNNRVHDNTTQGIVFEISDGARITNNNIWNNGWNAPTWGLGAGILVSSSADVDVSGNVVAWNKAGISVVEQKRPDGVPARNIDVAGNTILRNVVPGDYWANLSLAWLEDGSSAMYDPAANNRGSNNAFWYDEPETEAVRVTWQDQYARLSDGAATPGDQGGHYLSDADKDQLLISVAMPTAGGPAPTQ